MSKNTPTKSTGFEGERIAKRMARAGLCSRREAEAWIAEGRVSVNGKKIDSPALNVTEADEITVSGTKLGQQEATRLWLYHKPSGLVTTHKDPQGRPTVFQMLPKALPRVISVGRLDLNSEGLLLLTNDGALARQLELPATGWIRRYRVRAYGTLPAGAIEAMREGVVIAGVHYGAIDVEIERESGKNRWYVVSLREGKNR
ncbi:MAG: rRNA pseudouridine synthase, partial [Alphaproteobacteria bacterium]|nr:rRNA pseudouridine synthase [Alphaproteobacteria bacterium]